MCTFFTITALYVYNSTVLLSRNWGPGSFWKYYKCSYVLVTVLSTVYINVLYTGSTTVQYIIQHGRSYYRALWAQAPPPQNF